MSRLSKTLYKECPKCEALSFGRFDLYCSRCGTKLPQTDLAGISDYAKATLVEFLEEYPGIALTESISEIPSYATEDMRNNGNVMFSTAATRQVLAECWNEVEIALDDYRKHTGLDYPVGNVEDLHVFSVYQHTQMAWHKITGSWPERNLDDESLAEAIDGLKNL